MLKISLDYTVVFTAVTGNTAVIDTSVAVPSVSVIVYPVTSPSEFVTSVTVVPTVEFEIDNNPKRVIKASSLSLFVAPDSPDTSTLFNPALVIAVASAFKLTVVNLTFDLATVIMVVLLVALYIVCVNRIHSGK